MSTEDDDYPAYLDLVIASVEEVRMYRHLNHVWFRQLVLASEGGEQELRQAVALILHGMEESMSQFEDKKVFGGNKKKNRCSLM